MPRVQINVGGKQFECHSNTLKKWPDTLLADLDETSVFWDEERNEYFFDRDPKMFSFILNFYRFGELHLPHNVCGPAMRRELEFFGVQDKSVAHCCWKAYNSYSDQERAIQMIEKAFAGETFILKKDASKWQKIKHKVWHFLEDPTYSKGAKIYSWIFGGLLILTVIITILSTTEELRVPVPYDEQKLENETNPKIKLFITTEQHLALEIIDIGLLFFFTIELFTRFITCPNKKMFLRGFFSLIDIIAVLPKWVYFIVEKVYTDRGSDVLVYVQAFLAIGEVFRVLRILKLAKNFTGLKVLILTVRASLTEMSLVLFLILTGSMIFAVLVFYSEFWTPDTFPDITVGSYWALITMTTVGYGDIYPKSIFGRLVAVITAITGIFCTGLPIPIIANNFDLYYSYARIRKAMIEREKENRQNLKKRVLLGTKKAFNMAAAIAAAGKRPFGLPKKPITETAAIEKVGENSKSNDTTNPSKGGDTNIQIPSVSNSVKSVLSTRTPRDVTMTVSDELSDETSLSATSRPTTGNDDSTPSSSRPSSSSAELFRNNNNKRKKTFTSILAKTRNRTNKSEVSDIQLKTTTNKQNGSVPNGSVATVHFANGKLPNKDKNPNGYSTLENVSSPSTCSIASTVLPGSIDEDLEDSIMKEFGS